jgi:hypothetical protein
MTTGPSEPGGPFEEPPDGAEEDAQLAPPAEAEAEAEEAGVGPPTEPSLPEIPPALLTAGKADSGSSPRGAGSASSGCVHP